MIVPELVINTATVVVRGSFDVKPLAPQNLADQGLIDSDQLSDATQRFNTDDISIFETKRIKFLGNRELLQFTAQEADEFEPLRDFASGALRILDSPQIGVLGINRDVHFAVGSAAKWHAVGDTLVPKAICENLLNYPGTTSLTIQGMRSGIYSGFSQITIQPSNFVPQGVFVSHNDHYTLEIEEARLASRDQFAASLRQQAKVTSDKLPLAIRILNEEWEASMARAQAVIEQVAKLAQ